jgi:hypothetical protein
VTLAAVERELHRLRADLAARVVRALEALGDGELDIATAILEDVEVDLLGHAQEPS